MAHSLYLSLCLVSCTFDKDRWSLNTQWRLIIYVQTKKQKRRTTKLKVVNMICCARISSLDDHDVKPYQTLNLSSFLAHLAHKMHRKLQPNYNTIDSSDRNKYALMEE